MGRERHNALGERSRNAPINDKAWDVVGMGSVMVKSKGKAAMKCIRKMCMTPWKSCCISDHWTEAVSGYDCKK